MRLLTPPHPVEERGPGSCESGVQGGVLSCGVNLEVIGVQWHRGHPWQGWALRKEEHQVSSNLEAQGRG